MHLPVLVFIICAGARTILASPVPGYMTDPAAFAWKRPGSEWPRPLHPECRNLVATLRAHERRMLEFPGRQPLIYNPTHHGLGDRMKGACFARAVSVFFINLFFATQGSLRH